MSELNYWKTKLQTGGISRREFMGRAAALGASTAVISSLLASADAIAAETPRKGGTLRLGLGGGSTTDSVDITSYNDSVMIDTGRGLFNGLVEWGQDGKPKPDLASSFEPANGAKDWIFNLRKGVTFSNGKEVTADDVVYSTNLHRGASKSGGAGSMKGISDVKKLDKYQVQISLVAADADLPYVLTDYHALVVPDGFKDWAKPVGTGAFVLEKFDPGVRISLKKARDYWKEGRGHLDGVEVTVINDSSARINALVSGQIDAINRVDHKAVALLSKSPKLQIVRAAGGWHAVLAMQVDKPPYDNPDIRLALKYATDREQILKALFSGYGTQGNDHPIAPTDPYFNSELPQRKHDPERAAFHFKKAGIADPKILLQASDAAFAGAVDEGALFQASCAAGRHQGRSEEGAGGRLLGQRLAQGRLRFELLGRPRRRDADAVGRLRPRRAVERNALEQRQVREAARRRARRDRRGQAQALYLGNAEDAARRRRRDHPDVPRLARCAQHQRRRPYAARRLRHGQRHDHGKGLAQGVIRAPARPPSTGWARRPGDCVAGAAPAFRLPRISGFRLDGDARGDSSIDEPRWRPARRVPTSGGK